MADAITVQHILPTPEDQVRIKLTKNSKGYGWEISVAGKDSEEALSTLRDVEQKISTEYGNGEA